MSYAGLGIIGCTDGRERGLGVGGKCCPDSTWTNLVYTLIKGKLSYRHKNEKRVRHALALLRERTAGDAAWEPDVGPVTVDPKLRAAVLRASQNFDAIYPRSRWVKVMDGAGQDRPCGPYNTWTAGPAAETPAYQAALAEVVAGLPSEMRAPGHFALKDPAYVVIHTVPTSELGATAGSLPPLSLIAPIEKTASGAVLAPTAWTQTMLKRLAPMAGGALLTGGRRRFMFVAPKPATAQISRGIRISLDPEDEEAAEDFPWLAVGAGVALVGAGAAYWYFAR